MSLTHLSYFFCIFKIKCDIHSIQNKDEYYGSIIPENCTCQKLKGHTCMHARAHTHTIAYCGKLMSLTYCLLAEKCVKNCNFLQWESAKTTVVKWLHWGFFRRPVEERKANSIHTMTNFPVLLPDVWGNSPYVYQTLLSTFRHIYSAADHVFRI